MNMKISIFNKIDLNLLKIFSNYFGRAWGFLSILICTPFYIKYLGLESYAIIGLYTLILAIISLADAGMASAVTKEFSLNRGSSYNFNLLIKIEKIYLAIFFLICLIIILLSGYLSENWINASHISSEDIKNYIILIGIGACIQMTASIYYGAIYGLGNQIIANNYQILWVTSKSILVLFLLKYYLNSLYVFFIWQIVCNIVYVLILRSYVMKNINHKNDIIFDKKFKISKDIVGYIGGMSLISIISALNSQLDKVAVSNYFELKTFGYYSMSAYLSQITIFLSIPLASFFFPLLTRRSEDTNNELFEIIMKNFIKMLYFMIIPFVFVLLFYPQEILIFWTKTSIDSHVLNEIKFLMIFLTIGSLFFALQLPFYYAFLAKSKTKYVIHQGLIQLAINVPFLLFFSIKDMFKYIGLAWFFSNLIAYIYIVYFYQKSTSNFLLKEYFIRYVILPTFISILVFYSFYSFYSFYKSWFVVFILLSFWLSFFCNIFTFNVMNGNKYFDIKSFYDFPK
ncbi:hypothetical protein IC784_17510 [Acinetobacter seifertii]|uniref:Oligosaccharide flippase family protein n=1 Tax=Acinetobacter seifertii TaxID=1530123 RepID=A0A7H2TAE7_9GAMM|nr:hypothetical protein IC795_17840 [Acinetobacter seifertii]QNX48830.1 hypothetical protein IC784_17510 [Acinetobacter seifertii]QNY17283.1 hypothetical protein IC765_18300 [Acinetobacter seifertii]